LSREVEVVRTYLELRSREELRPVPVNATDSSVAFVHRPAIGVPEYRRLYEAVGYRWYWRDRNAWSDERLASHLARPEIFVWECLVDGQSAGYFELERRDDDSVEIAYFGLIETFVGRGAGKAMLARAAMEAWALGPNRVWLHTCTLDSPHALPNYKARGFVPFRTETYVATVDD
jgi:GNAT superfamily N-acetyltransferase